MHTERYSCQMELPGFGKKAQERLFNARVLIVGAGGLGCPAAQYLASCGVGTLGIADDDTVSLSNLHRQILYTPVDAGKPKAQAAAEWLMRQNPDITIVSHPIKVTTDNVLQILMDYDIIIDCTDNFDTRYLLNDAAVLSGKPLVYGSVYQYEGQVAVWNILNADGGRSANYRDLFPQVDATQVPNCTEGGVIPTLTGIIGCMQANEAIKYITQTGEILASKLLLFSALTLQSQIIKLPSITKTAISTLPGIKHVDSLSVQQLKKELETGNIELIDIRSSAEHDDFNIGGRHIPAYKLESAINQLDMAKTMVLYCTIGKRSAEVVIRLKELNPALSVCSLEGGIKAWIANNI